MGEDQPRHRRAVRRGVRQPGNAGSRSRRRRPAAAGDRRHDRPRAGAGVAGDRHRLRRSHPQRRHPLADPRGRHTAAKPQNRPTSHHWWSPSPVRNPRGRRLGGRRTIQRRHPPHRTALGHAHRLPSNHPHPQRRRPRRGLRGAVPVRRNAHSRGRAAGGTQPVRRTAPRRRLQHARRLGRHSHRLDPGAAHGCRVRLATPRQERGHLGDHRAGRRRRPTVRVHHLHRTAVREGAHQIRHLHPSTPRRGLRRGRPGAARRRLR